MKINGDAPLLPSYLDSDRVNKRDALSGIAETRDAHGSKAGQNSIVAPSAGSVSMSKASALAKTIEQQPSIRVDLVNDLKARIANGTYTPSPDLIATAMVDSAFDIR